MKNPNLHRTPEERKASAAKGLATRRSNQAAKASTRRADSERHNDLLSEIAYLEDKLTALQAALLLSISSAELSGSRLMMSSEIVSAAKGFSMPTGIYFLISENRVVYVGQSTDVYYRIKDHIKNNKKFDRYAYVPCREEALDKLESLYIHFLSPELNGNWCDGSKRAPIPLDKLIGI